MEMKCHSRGLHLEVFNQTLEGKELGRMEGKVVSQLFLLCLKHLQEIQVEMLRRQIMLVGLERQS